MPQWNNFHEVRVSLIEAYRHIEPLEDLEEIEGSTLQKTQSIVYNIQRRQHLARINEWKEYYRIAQLWDEEVEHIWNRKDREICQRALKGALPAYAAKMADRIYQLFKHKPSALNHFQCSMHQLNQLTQNEMKELEEEVKQLQRDFSKLELYLEV